MLILLYLKPGFHSNARNARKALRTKNYAVKIKSTQATQRTQENNASEKQNYTKESDASRKRSLCGKTQEENRSFLRKKR